MRRVRGVLIVIGAVAVAASCSSSSSSSSSSAKPAASTTTAPVDCTPVRPAAAGSTIKKVAIGGVDRTYKVTIPPNYNGTTKRPVLVNLHGFTSNIAEQDAASRYPEEAGKRGYIVVTPQALDVEVELKGKKVKQSLWNIFSSFTPPKGEQQKVDVKDDVTFITSQLDTLEQQLCIDKQREYVSGMSAGAGMTMMLICNKDTRFAAAAPVSGVNLATVCPAKHATPIITFHGDADPLVNYKGGDIFGFHLGLPTVQARMDQFAKLADCDPKAVTTDVAPDVRHTVWKCPAGAGNELYTVVGGGHTWPGGPGPATNKDLENKTMSIDASNLALDFFDQHVRS